MKWLSVRNKAQYSSRSGILEVDGIVISFFKRRGRLIQSRGGT